MIARETPPHQRPLSDGLLNVFWRDTVGSAQRHRWTVSIANIYSCDWFDSICEHELLISYH